ncbi:MAG: helix-turn-helix transcriptional regulator [Bacteroidales bacterium]|nr:helix-turn-helix transcriptional regulator [Bacteroidales bacterium]
MKNRIQKFIDYKNISPGELAEMLEVQRSNISHILNGRNKPGALFTEKLLTVFPQLNARWLFTGEGTMIMDAQGEPPAKDVKTSEVKSEPPVYYRKGESSSNDQKKESKTLEKVVLLYSDGTFVSYKTK